MNKKANVVRHTVLKNKCIKIFLVKILTPHVQQFPYKSLHNSEMQQTQNEENTLHRDRSDAASWHVWLRLQIQAQGVSTQYLSGFRQQAWFYG